MSTKTEQEYDEPCCGMTDPDDLEERLKTFKLVAGIAWRVAGSLDTLLGQVNSRFPQRSKLSDGSIGDAAHATRTSDHNPHLVIPPPPNVVSARDITNDPGHGLDAQVLADQIVQSRDNRVKYIISRRRIIDFRPQYNPFKWMPYSGSNPHDKHVHISVMDNKIADDRRPWNLPMFGGQPNVPPPPPPPVVTVSGLQMGATGPKVQELQRVMKAWYPKDLAALVVDGQYGAKTAAAVAFVQKRFNLAVDGIAGSQTLARLNIKL